jgi:hypothetical protein
MEDDERNMRQYLKVQINSLTFILLSVRHSHAVF